MHKLSVDCRLEIKAITDEGAIEGHAAVFGNIDHGLDRIERGAFKEWIKTAPGAIPMLWQHRPDEPIGVWDSMSEDRKGLYLKGSINQDVQRGREARSLAAQGAVTGLSIGYFPKEFRYEDDVRVLEKLDVIETSLATFPMNEEARVTSVKHLERADLERYLREDWNLSRKAARAFLHRGIDGLRDVIGSWDPGDGDEPSVLSDFENLLSQIRN